MLEILLFLFSLYCILFILSIFLKDNSIADVFWGLGFVIISLGLFLIEGNNSLSHMIVLGIISFWGLRLFSLFFTRKMRHNSEDPRYAKWRSQWKYFYLRSFLQVYMLQMLLMCIIAAPLFFVFTHSTLNPVFTIFGGVIAILGLAYEIIADKQIINFIKHKKKGENLVYTQGLWKYSRNPNYFGESIFWLGISIISLPLSYFGIIGYLTITFLLLYVSGIPMKEKRQRTKDNWEEYAAATNRFIPGVPK